MLLTTWQQQPENAHTQHVNGYDWEREWLRGVRKQGQWEQARATETSLGMPSGVGVASENKWMQDREDQE